MQVNVYLSFPGNCEEAFKFYEQHLNGRPGPLFRYGGSPMELSAAPDWAGKVMHASIRVGDHVLMGADHLPGRYEAPRGMNLSLQLHGVDEAERIFEALAHEGHIVTPLEKTFWAERFGGVVDRYGIPWIINCEPAPDAAV